MLHSQEANHHRIARYSAIAGVLLFAGLAANAAFRASDPSPFTVKEPLNLVDPSTDLAKDQPKTQPARSVRIISLERPRDNVRSQHSTASVAPSGVQSTTPSSAPSAPSGHEPALADFVGLPTREETARARRIAQAKISAERVKKPLARERARTREIAVRKQGQNSNGQLAPPDYAYAPRPAFGPFSDRQNSWGNGSAGEPNGRNRL